MPDITFPLLFVAALIAVCLIVLMDNLRMPPNYEKNRKKREDLIKRRIEVHDEMREERIAMEEEMRLEEIERAEKAAAKAASAARSR